jgi:hypothetical protein
MSTIQEQAAAHASGDEQVARAVARGGLPTEAEAGELDAALQKVFDQLESIASRVGGVSQSTFGDDLPFAVTLADIGVLALIVESVNLRIDDFRGHCATITRAVGSIDSIRHEQQARSAA